MIHDSCTGLVEPHGATGSEMGGASVSFVAGSGLDRMRLAPASQRPSDPGRRYLELDLLLSLGFARPESVSIQAVFARVEGALEVALSCVDLSGWRRWVEDSQERKPKRRWVQSAKLNVAPVAVRGV